MIETWLHVGMPKCGSTTLQRHFARHDEAHRAHGLLYPVTGRNPAGYRSHRPLLHAGDDLPALLDGIAGEAREAGAARLVVSSEAFAEHQPGDPRGPAIADGLAAATGGPVRVVAWLRHPADLAVSAFAQLVRAGIFGIDREAFWRGGPASVERFLAAFRHARGRDLLSPLGHAEAVRAAFSGHEVMLRSAERDDLGRGLLADFCALFEVPRLPGPARRNRRWADRATALAIEAQERLGPAAFDDRRADLAPWLSGIEPGPFAPARLRLPAAALAALNETLERERPALRRQFATPVDAMTAPREPDPGTAEWLGPEDLEELCRRLAP